MKIENEKFHDPAHPIDQTAEAILGRHPALEGLVTPFASLFKAKAGLVEELKQGPHRIPLPVGALASETPSLMGIDFEPFREPLEQAAESMLEAMAASFPALSRQASHIADAMKAHRIDLVLLAGIYLGTGSQALSRRLNQQKCRRTAWTWRSGFPCPPSWRHWFPLQTWKRPPMEMGSALCADFLRPSVSWTGLRNPNRNFCWGAGGKNISIVPFAAITG